MSITFSSSTSASGTAGRPSENLVCGISSVREELESGPGSGAAAFSFSGLSFSVSKCFCAVYSSL